MFYWLRNIDSKRVPSSRFAIEVQPTGEVTEYTATITYDLLAEGKEGRQKVDLIELALKAEGRRILT